ncbi:MAG: hypothetical protein ACR2GR_10360 [Rhodothermales bacterium]
MNQAQRLFASWVAQQTEQMRQIRNLTFTEHVKWKLEGAFDAPLTEIEMQVTGRTTDDSHMWEREVNSGSVEGQPVSVLEAQRLLAQRQERLPSSLAARLSTLPLPALELASMLAVTPLTAADLDGEPCWKFDVVSPEEPGNDKTTHRVTLWLRQADNALLRSQAVILASSTSPASVITVYERVEGLDLPQTRQLESALQTQRRLRTFTSFLSLAATYSAYRLSGD